MKTNTLTAIMMAIILFCFGGTAIANENIYRLHSDLLMEDGMLTVFYKAVVQDSVLVPSPFKNGEGTWFSKDTVITTSRDFRLRRLAPTTEGGKDFPGHDWSVYRLFGQPAYYLQEENNNLLQMTGQGVSNITSFLTAGMLNIHMPKLTKDKLERGYTPQNGFYSLTMEEEGYLLMNLPTQRDDIYQQVLVVGFIFDPSGKWDGRKIQFLEKLD